MARKQSFAKTVAAGSTVAAFEAMRDQIASDLEECGTMRDRAALYLRLADTLAAIEKARAAAPLLADADPVDQIARRRRTRRIGPPGTSPRHTLLRD